MASVALAACAHGPTRPARSPYDLVLLDVEGDRYALGQVRGQVAVVHFFATWCFPCLVEVPVLDALQGKYGSKGLRVVGVGMDLEGAKVLAPFAKSSDVRYPILVADDEVRAGRSPYGRIIELPTTYVLDRDGKIAAAYAGPANPEALEKLIARLVGD